MKQSENVIKTIEDYLLPIKRSTPIRFDDKTLSTNVNKRLTLVCNLTVIRNFNLQRNTATQDRANIVYANFNDLIRTIGPTSIDYFWSYVEKTIDHELFTIEYFEFGQPMNQILCSFANNDSVSIPFARLNSGERLFIEAIDRKSIELINNETAQLDKFRNQLQIIKQKSEQMNADLLVNDIERLIENVDQTLHDLNGYLLNWHCRRSLIDAPDSNMVNKNTFYIFIFSIHNLAANNIDSKPVDVSSFHRSN